MKRALQLITFVFLFAVATQSDAQQSKFSTDSLILYMKKIGVKHIKIALQQAKLETNYFSSPIFIENKNLFGMQLAWSRKHVAIGRKDNYALYSDWKNSVKDYYLWQNQFGSLTGKENYGKLLTNRKYNMNKNYVQTVLAVPITEHEMDLINGK